MKNLLIITFITFFTLSCIKKEQDQQIEGQIVELMNQNNTDEALIKIEEQLKIYKTDEVLYLKASSLSMKAGIDIYALFPLLKVKIFDVAISQWSQNREFQKKNMAQKTSIGISKDDIDDKIDTDLKKDERYVPIDKNIISYQIAQESVIDFYSKERPYCNIEVFLIQSDVIKEIFAYLTIKIDVEDECLKMKAGAKLPINPEIEDRFKNALAAEHQRHWYERKKDQNRSSSYIKLMGTFWTLIDLVPMISKIPIINQSGFSNLEEAQTILFDIRSRHSAKSDKLGEKVRKQLMMISALKIVSHLKNAFNFDIIKSPMDFICASNESAAEDIFASHKDALYLINTIDDQEVISKNQSAFDEVRLRFEELLKIDDESPELKELRIKKLYSELQKSKEENCE